MHMDLFSNNFWRCYGPNSNTLFCGTVLSNCGTFCWCSWSGLGGKLRADERVMILLKSLRYRVNVEFQEEFIRLKGHSVADKKCEAPCTCIKLSDVLTLV